MASKQILRRSSDILHASSARAPTFRQASSALMQAQPSAQYATASSSASASPALPSASLSARVPFGSHVSGIASCTVHRGFAITATEDLVKLPCVSDPSALSTLKEALATGWVPCDASLIAKIDKSIKSTDADQSSLGHLKQVSLYFVFIPAVMTAVSAMQDMAQEALPSLTDMAAAAHAANVFKEAVLAKEALSALKAAAEAVEVFGEKLELLRLELAGASSVAR
ncbi:unnamed protein product [Closterium sp. Naga37s-1]|nr:unnamed protein product [Closterium sp. Naga37s-1]